LDESTDTGEYRRLRTATKSPMRNLYNTITEGGDPLNVEKPTRRRHLVIDLFAISNHLIVSTNI